MPGLRAPRPEPPGQGSQANTLKAGPLNKGRMNRQTDGKTNGRTDKWTDEQNIPCILQDIAALLTIRKSEKKRKAGYQLLFNYLHLKEKI